MANDMLNLALSDLLTPEETAEWIKVTVETLAVWRCNKKHLSYTKVGDLPRYCRVDVLRYLASKYVSI